MRKYLIILFTLILFSCEHTKEKNDFINTDCNIPIIECVLNKDTVNFIVDTGAEYSLINSEYYQNNQNNFRLINEIETQFSGIGGINIQTSSVLLANTSLGYITFIEQNLSAVVKSFPQYNIVGLIGSDFFKSRNYIVDYKMRKVYPYELRDSIYGKK